MEYIDEIIEEYNAVIKKISSIAESNKTSGDVLEKISEVDDNYILACVMTNPNTPSKILEKFMNIYTGVGGVDDEVRIHIVSNVALELDVLKKVIQHDPSERVRQAASASFARRKSEAR